MGEAPPEPSSQSFPVWSDRSYHDATAVTRASELHTNRGLAVLVDERTAPGFAVKQRLAHRVRRAAVVQVRGDQRASRAQKPTQRLVHRRRWRLSVEERDIVARIEGRQDRSEVALMHGDTVVHGRARDIFLRQPHMFGVALDAKDKAV